MTGPITDFKVSLTALAISLLSQLVTFSGLTSDASKTGVSSAALPAGFLDKKKRILALKLR